MNQQIKTRIEQIKKGELPEGYKKTKVGIVPNEWDDTHFSTLFNEYSEYTSDEEKFPLYSLTIENGITAKSERYERSHLVKKENAYKILPSNHFAFNPMNVRFGAVARHKSNFDVSVSGYYDIFTTKLSSDLEFMDNYLISYQMIQYYNKVSTGSLVEKQRVHFSQFLEFNLPLPNEKQRKKIAEILTAQDKVIELKEKLIAEKEAQKKYLMQNLLTGKKRLKGFSGEWKKVKLGDICVITTGNKDVQNKVENGEYPFFIRSEKIERINSFAFDGEAILIPGDGKIGEIYHYIVGKFDFHQRVYMLSKFSNNRGLFLLYFLKHFFKKRALSMTAKATVDSLRREMLTGMPVNLPPLPEQNAIAEILSTADREIELLKAELAEQKQKKKALMQLLLTGIVRVES